MSRSFNLTAELNLRGPSNIRTVVADIRRQIGNIDANVNININQATTRDIGVVNQGLVSLNRHLRETTVSAGNTNRSIQNLSNTFRSFGSNLNNIPKNIQASATAAQNLTQTASRTSSAVAATASEFEEFGKQSALAVRRFAAFATVTGIIFKVNNAIASASQEFLDFNKELVRVSQVTDSSLSSLGGLVNTITDLSTRFGVASKDLITVSSTLAQAGLNAKETETALKALALSALAPSFDSLNDTVEGSIALMRQFGLGAKDLESALGSINAVAAKFAVESSDIITAIQRTGGVFAAASKGVSEGKDALNEFVAVFTSVRATTRESAETIATGLRTIFTRIQRADTIDALKAYGVSLTDLTGKFVGPYEAVKRLSEGLNQLDPRDLRFSRIVEELGGFRQIGKVIPLIQQFKTSQEALKVAQQGQSSLATDAATAQQSLANKITKVREEFVALIRSIGQNENFQSFVRLSLDLTSGLIRLADSAKSVLPALTAIAAIRGTSFLAQYATGFVGGIRSSRSQAPARGAANGGFMGFATGGLVPGVGDADTFKAKLTPGEFVMKKSAVRSIGASNLSRMNMGGEPVQKFMEGSNTAAGVARRRQTENRKPVDGMYSISTAGSNQQSVKDFYDSLGQPYRVKGKKRKVFDDLNAGTDTQKSHIGGNIPLSKKQIQNYASRYSNSQFRRSVEGAGFKYENIQEGKFNRESFLSATGLQAKERVMLNLPKTFNQALRRFDRNLVSVDGLVSFISKSSNLFVGKPRFTDQVFKKQDLINATKNLPARTYDDSDRPNVRSFDSDSELDFLKSIISNQSQNNLDLFFKPSKEDSTYIDKKTGIERIRTQSRSTAQRSKLKNMGGIIQNFMGGSPGGVKEAELTPGEFALQKAAKSEIIRVLGIDKASKAAGVSASEVNKLLRIQNPDIITRAKQEAIEKEYIKAINRKAGSSQASATRMQNKGLEFAAAGMFGSAFPDQAVEINSPLLSSSPKVRMVSGIMNPELATKLEKTLLKGSNKLAQKASKQAMISDILEKFGMGKELNLDFDRTLAFGADKILKDPRTPAFAEFGDRNKVSEALKRSKLSNLGKELVNLVKPRPELLPFMKVISARPQSTVDLIQQWLSSKGLPIPEGQFKGLGGPSVTAQNIADLKAALLSPGSLFVDDDPRNIAAAEARGDISSYQYGAKLATPNINTDSSIQGGLLEKVIQNLGGPGSVKGLGFDFPNGLRSAAKYFDIPSDIPTDVKRTVSGPSTIKDNVVTYLKNVMGYNSGGAVRKFAEAGKVTFGTGTTEFPKRVSNAYEREIKDAELKKASEKIFNNTYSSPKNETMSIDADKVREAHDKPFDKKRFLSTFTGKIKRDSLYQDMADFTKLIGLPRENIDLALPEIIDFVPNLKSLGQFDRTGMTSRGAQSLDVSGAGFTKAQEQDLYGYKKLIEEKRKQVDKITKTPVKTYDDGSFSYDTEAARAVWDELGAAQNNYGKVASLKSTALEQTIQDIQGKAATTGRGSVSVRTSDPFRSSSGGGDSSTLYHEMTHQLINGLRTRNAESFTKYKERVLQLFTGDNDDLSEAFDALNSNYSSADIVYGKAYKVSNLNQIIDYNRNKPGTRPDSETAHKEALGIWSKAMSIKKAREFKPLNPAMNKTLLDNGLKQSYIDRIEDSGKEEFLTTLVQNSNKLDGVLSSTLDATLNELLGSAGIKRQSYAIGGRLAFKTGGIVPALVSNGEGYVPPDMAKSIGYSQLNKLNQADRNGLASFAGGGGVSLFKGPGHGTSDSIGPIGLPVGSFILREKAVKALGLNRGGSVGTIKKFANGGGGFGDDTLNSQAIAIAKDLMKNAGLSAKDALDQARQQVRGPQLPPRDPNVSMVPQTLRTPSGSRLTDAQKAATAIPVDRNEIERLRLARRAASRGDVELGFERNEKGRIQANRRTGASGADINATGGRGGNWQNGVWNRGDSPLASQTAMIKASSSSRSAMSPTYLNQALNNMTKSAQQSSTFFDRIKNAASVTATKATGIFSRVTGRGMSPEDRERIQQRNQNWANRGMALAFTGPMIADQIGSMIGGSKGAAIGGGGAAIGSAVAVGAQFGPWGALAGVVAGAAMAFEGANKAVAEFENTLSDNKIKTATDDLDKNLQLMAKDPKNMAARQAAAASFKILTNEEDAKAKRNEDIRKPGMISSGLSSADQYLRTSTLGNLTGYAAGANYFMGPGQTPQQAREQRDLQLRNDQQTGFQQSQARLNAAMSMTSGKGFSAAMGTMGPEEQKAIKKNIAQGQAGFNVSYEAMEKQKTQTTDPQLMARIEKEQEALIEQYFNQGTQLERAAAADAQRASSVAKLTQSINTATTSIARTFENMNQAVNKSMFNIESASEKIESIASGRASLKSSFGKMSENILRNPNVYSAQDRTQAVRQVSGFFGQDEKFVQRLVDFGDTVKDTISSITATSQSSNMSPEAMVDSIDREISNKLLSQFGNNSLTTQIRQQIRGSLEQQSKSEDGIDVQKILDSSGINNLIDGNKQALESMINQFNMVRSALDLFGNAVGKAAEIQTQIIDKIAAGTEALASVDVRKKDLFGQDVSLAERSRGRSQAFEIRAGVKAGGATAANLLSQRTMQQNTRDNIERQRDSIEKSGNSANPALIAQTQKLTKSLAEWDQKLQRSENAIENLPSLIQGNIDDIFNELQKALSKRENKNQAGAAFAEKLVTSTPQELNGLNSTFALLNNTLSGNITTFNNSAVAQKAYQEAINNGSTQVEAMTAAQSAFASENKNMFSLFNELISVSNMKPEEANSLRSDLIRNTAKAQGLNVDNNPMINQILSSLEKPPQEDPKIVALTRALEEQKAALVNAYEAAANVLGDKMTKLINAAGEAVANAIRSTPLNFGNAQNTNASMGIMRPGNVLGRSSGGVVYASTGTLVPYQPRGTDTVPAMLTPGEFVINRSATQQHLPLLKAINNGNYAKGGVVYLEDGGFGSRLGQNVAGSPVDPATAKRVWARLINRYGPDSDMVFRFARDYGIGEEPYTYLRTIQPDTPSNVSIDTGLTVKEDLLEPLARPRPRPRGPQPNFRFGGLGDFWNGFESMESVTQGSPLSQQVNSSMGVGNSSGFMSEFRDIIQGFTSTTSLSSVANDTDGLLGLLYRSGDMAARGGRGIFRGSRNLLSAGLRMSPGLALSTLANIVLGSTGLDSNIVNGIGAGADLGLSGALAARAGGTFMGGAGIAAPGLLATNTALSFLSETGQLVFDNQNYRRGLNEEDQAESAGRTGLFERGSRSLFGSTGSSAARFADNTVGWIGGGISGALNPFRTFYKAGSAIGQSYNEISGSAEEKAARSNDIMGASRMTQQEYNNAKMDRQIEMSRYETTRTDASGQTTNIPEHLRGLSVVERNYVSRMATLEKAIEEAKDDYAARNTYGSFPRGRWDAMTPQEKMQDDSTLYNLEQEYNTTQRKETTQTGYLYNSKVKDTRYKASDATLDQAIEKERTYRVSEAKKEKDRVANKQAAADKAKKDSRAAQEQKQIEESNRKKERDKQDRQFTSIASGPNYFGDVASNNIYQSQVQDREKADRTKTGYVKDSQQASGYIKRPPIPDVISENQKLAKERQDIDRQIYDLDSELSSNLDTNNPFRDTTDPKILKERHLAERKRLEAERNKADRRIITLNTDPKINSLSLAERDSKWKDYEDNNRKVQKDLEKQQNRQIAREQNRQIEQQASLYTAIARAVGGGSLDQIVARSSISDNPRGFVSWKQRAMKQLQKKFYLSGRTSDDIAMLSRYGMPPKVAQQLLQPVSDNQSKAIIEVMRGQQRGGLAKYSAKDIALLSMNEEKIVQLRAMADSRVNNSATRDARLTENQRQRLEKAKEELFVKTLTGFSALEKAASNAGGNLGRQQLVRKNLYKKLAKDGYINPNDSPEANSARLQNLGLNNSATLLYPTNDRFMPANNASRGGVIYASNGTLVNFQPKGTDTVPAMLTPGEFVVNERATSEHLPLLKAINNSKGGQVSYLATGGLSGSTQSSSNIRNEQQKAFDTRITSNTIKSIQAQSYTTQKTVSDIRGSDIPRLSFKTDSYHDQDTRSFVGIETISKKTHQTLEDIKSSQQLSSGGIVYASNGKLINFASSGTDTVPAMLTPGEFVVNAKATSQHLPLLKSINNGDTNYLSRGGLSCGNCGQSNCSCQKFAKGGQAKKLKDNKNPPQQQQMNMFPLGNNNQQDPQGITYDLRDRQQQQQAINSAYIDLLPYTSGPRGAAQFSMLFGQGLQNTSLKFSRPGNPGNVRPLPNGQTVMTMPTPMVTKSLIDHELGHVLQVAANHNGMEMNLMPWIQNFAQYMNTVGFKADHLPINAGGTGYYTPQDLLNKPIEVFPSILQLKSQDPQGFSTTGGDQALRIAMANMGFSKGGIVYAQQGGSIDKRRALAEGAKQIDTTYKNAVDNADWDTINQMHVKESTFNYNSLQKGLYNIHEGLQERIGGNKIKKDIRGERLNRNDSDTISGQIDNLYSNFSSDMDGDSSGLKGFLSSLMDYENYYDPRLFDEAVIKGRGLSKGGVVYVENGGSVKKPDLAAQAIGQDQAKERARYKAYELFLRRFGKYRPEDPQSARDVVEILRKNSNEQELNRAAKKHKAIQDAKNQIDRENKASFGASGFNNGGIVYAADGGSLDDLIRGSDSIDVNNLPMGEEKRIVSQRPIVGLTQRFEENPSWSNLLFRSLLPSSEASQKTTYSDGTTQINMGGGPSSGELTKQLPSSMGAKAGAKAAMSAGLPKLKRFGGGLSTTNAKSAAQEAFEEFTLGRISSARAPFNPSKETSRALYHASNTGIEDSVLKSFQREGGKSNIAQGYGQGKGLYAFTSKDAALKHAQGIKAGNTVTQADSSGQPMIVKFLEELDPAKFDLDYELNAGYVARWLHDNFEKIQQVLSDQKSPMLLGKGFNPAGGQKGIQTQVATNSVGGSAALDLLMQTATKKAPRRWIYDTADSIMRDGEVLSKILQAVGKRDPKLLLDFRQGFFDTMPAGSAIKYIGSDNLMPAGIEVLNKSGGGVIYASTGKLVNYQPRGTDTVPAMLTPGEFVVNRSATQQHLPLLRAINSNNYQYGDMVKPGGRAQKTNKRHQGIMQERRDAYESMMSERRSTYENTMSERRSDYANRSSYTPAKQAPQQTSMAFNFTPVFNGLNQFVGVLNIATRALTTFGQQNPGNSGNSVSNNSNTSLDGLSQFTAQFNDFIGQLQKLNLPEVINVQGNHKVEVVINGGQALQNLLEGPIGSLVQNQVKSAFDRLSNNTEGSIRNPYA